MKRTIWNARFPTSLGIFLLVLIVGITAFFVQQKTNLFQNAAPSDVPTNIRITNITDSSFTVTYETDAVTTGVLSIGKAVAVGQTILDEQDQRTNTPSPYTIHSITAEQLSPQTHYFFSIISGTTTYLNNGIPFDVTTGKVISTAPSSQVPLSGKIVMPDGSTAQEALVYATAANTQTISTRTKSNGIYILPLNTIRTSDLSAYDGLQSTDTIQLLIIGPHSMQSRALISVQNSNTIPTIVLNNDYDFTASTLPLASSSAGLSSIFPFFSVNTTPGTGPEIVVPGKNQTFTDQQPVFTGKALPNATVTITIHSDAGIQTQVIADRFGNWSLRPKSPLPSGTHTITIVTRNTAGILQTMQQSFVIFASGTQVEQSATPSATPTVVITPTSIPTPTPTPTSPPTPTPTEAPAVGISPVVTLTPTPTPTIAPTIPITITPLPTKKPLPPTGSNTVTVIGITGIITAVVGGLLFVLTKGGLPL